MDYKDLKLLLEDGRELDNQDIVVIQATKEFNEASERLSNIL